MQGWYAVVVAVNACFLVVAVSNIVYLHAATKKPRIRSCPFVSVIVPARNEEGSISRCLESLLSQDYEDYEVIVVDDVSSDRTHSIVAALEPRDPRLRLVSGTPPGEGWMGKTHALAEGAAVCGGEILILTDADSVHEPHSISWAVTNLEDHHADMLSGYLKQEYGSFGESLVVPVMYAMLLLLPLFLIPRTRSPRTAFAIGQYVAIRREALDGVGGFEAIKGSIVDDMAMAGRIKAFGYRDVFLDARGAARCRLYGGYWDAFHGIERSIYSAVGGNPLAVAVVAVIVLGVIVGPALSVLVSWARFRTTPGPFALPVVLFAVQWALVSSDRKVPFAGFVLYPLVFLHLLIILTASMLTTGLGSGIDWKGRRIHVPSNPGTSREVGISGSGSRPGRGRP